MAPSSAFTPTEPPIESMTRGISISDSVVVFIHLTPYLLVCQQHTVRTSTFHHTLVAGIEGTGMPGKRIDKEEGISSLFSPLHRVRCPDGSLPALPRVCMG